ncbi:MAG: penicillin amidase [Paracoccaceae bacterium]|jgi:penicillin amidase
MIKKFALRLTLIVLLPLSFLAVAGILWLRTSLPGLSENIALPGIEAPVEVVHDSNGIPHIIAGSTSDAYRALGFLHARDRLFQMDFMRRLGAGRLSEVTGRPTLQLDRTMRTLGLYRLAGETVSRMPPDARAALDAYAAGVNAFLASRSGALPPEFVVLRYQPEQWTPADSLVWGRLMAMRLTGNWRTEALRAALAERLSAAQLADLWPRGTDVTPATLAGILPMKDTARIAKQVLIGIPDWLRQVSASNSWLVSGTGTQTGKPVLANDPHLGYRAPGLWYLARISAPGLDVTGATVPGVPFHILGHNGRIAWGFTTTDSDTQDLFVERLDTDRPGHYLTPGGSAPFVTRQETITIKDAPAETFTVRETRHGPVISDIYNNLTKVAGESHVIALAATSLRADDMTPLALFGFNKAQNWQDFRDAARHFHTPQQNISYADTGGNIGFISPGRVPVRRTGLGRRPVPGWTGTYDWTGFIPFDALPQSYNPASGRIVNANHRIVPDSYEWYLTDDWSAPYRARRIYAALDTTEPHTVAQSLRLQTDTLSLAAKDLLPVLLGNLDARTEKRRRVAALLQAWDRQMSRDAAAPLIYSTWLVAVNRALYADELGPLFPQYFGLRPRVVLHMLTKRTAWCDDVTTEHSETCREIVSRALDTAVLSLEDKYGGDIDNWRWGKAHQAVFSHPLFGRIPVIKQLSDIRIEADGGPYTVSRAQSRIGDSKAPFASVHGPGYRAVYDLSDLANSRFATATGQSGNPLSPLYANTTRNWRDGKYIKIPQTRADAIKETMGITRLTPAK